MGVANSTDQLTAIEACRRNKISEDARRIVESLAVTNQMLLDAPVMEANEGTKDVHIIRTVHPTIAHRKMYEGVAPSASRTKQIEDVMCQLTGYSDIDVKQVREQANPQQFVSDECASFVEAMGEDMQDDLFYGSNAGANPNTNGFAIRRGSLDTRCIGLGGTGNSLTSAYLIKWGRRMCRLVYPRGAKNIGVSREDHGQKTVTDANGGKFEAVENYFECNYGLSVVDERAFIRFANIATSLNADDLVEAIFKNKNLLPPGDGTIQLAVNGTVMGLLQASVNKKTNVTYTAEDPWGHEVLKIGDIRVRQCDSLIFGESAVTA